MTQPILQQASAARVTLILATVCVAMFWLVSSVSADPGGKIIHIQAGQFIQTAIDKADGGDRIIVEAGTYAERLTIMKDGIALIGHNAILVRPTPDTSKPNICSGLAGPGTEAGICIQGTGVKLGDFQGEHRPVLSVDTPVKGVSVTGFQVRDFTGLNIAIVGAQDTRVTNNALIDGTQYGVLTVGSRNSGITHNTVVWTKATLPFIGICNDDVATPHVAHNQITGYNIGLCVQTAGADVSHNQVRNSCVGAFIDPGIKGAKIRHNHISDAGAICATPAGFIGVYGIIITGSVETQVRHNLIEGMTNEGRAAGIALFDDPPPSPHPTRLATGNVITQNTLLKNDLDLLVFTKGTGNVIKQNQCMTSQPPGLCAAK